MNREEINKLQIYLRNTSIVIKITRANDSQEHTLPIFCIIFSIMIFNENT